MEARKSLRYGGTAEQDVEREGVGDAGTAFNFPCATAFRPSVTGSLKCSPGFQY